MPPFLISLDFDGTLFDSPGRLKHMKELDPLSQAEFSTALSKFREQSEFLPDKFANFLHEQGLLTLEESRAIYDAFLTIPRDAANLVYPDANRFVSAFPRETMVIISRSHPDWQKPIIENSGLGNKVQNVFITQGDLGKQRALEPLLLRYKKIFHIDDQPDELKRLADIDGIEPIWLNRGLVPGLEGGYKSLDEIINVLLSSS